MPVGVAALVLAVGSSCAARRPLAPPTTQPLASPRDLSGVPNFARVSDVLYRGAQPNREGFTLLRAIGVKTVVDLRGEVHQDDLEGLGLKYVHIPSDVFHPRQSQMIEFLRVVNDPANQPVFVHCQRGADRTGCYVGVYRIVEQGWTARDAEAELPRFHFNPFFGDVPAFLRGLDAEKMRQELIEPPTRPATHSS